MINLLEEEYDAASGKYILHLTMGTEDTLSDLPSAEKPFNSSNYSCFFDYGEPAENSTAVDEESGEIYLYSNGEWSEPEPAGDTKILLITAQEPGFSVNGDSISDNINGIMVKTGDVVTGTAAFTVSVFPIDDDGNVGKSTGVEVDENESYTVDTDGTAYLSVEFS